MTADAQTAELLERLRVAVHADHRRHGGRRLGIVGVLVAAAVSGGAWAAATQAPWWRSGSAPVDPQAVASVARDNMPANVEVSRARTVAHDGSAALIAVPLDQTGYCLIPVLDGRGDLGARCEFQVADPQAGDDDDLESNAQPAGRPGGPAWIVYGRITDPRASALDLGAFTVALQTGGFFVAEIPQGQWPALDGTANAGSILDSSGAVLRGGCVNWGPSPASPDAGRGDTSLWADGSGPCKPELPLKPATVDYSRAEQVFQVALTADYSIWKAGTTIAFWQAPASDGTDCIFPGTTTEPDSGMGVNPPGGADCRNPASPWPAGEPTLHAGLGAQLVHVDHDPFYAHTTEGRVDPGSGIVSLELRSASGSTPVAFGGDYFFAQIPGLSTSADELPDGVTFTLVGYDSSGNEVASLDLTALQAQFVPH